MRLTGLRFALLVWIPGVLHGEKRVISGGSVSAVNGGESCIAPKLENGYFFPVQESYPHDLLVRYSCDTGYKPRKEGWWVTIRCQNGGWSDTPECVEETVCLPPVIPNGKFMQNPNGSFEINCNPGYLLNSLDNIVECNSGTLSTVPLCQRNPNACDQPPAVTNAVIIQTHQEVFEEVEYQCRDGYQTQDEESRKTAYCVAGRWVGIPLCKPTPRPEPRDTQPAFVSIDQCGEIPHVPNGVPLQQGQLHIKYKCQMYYKLVGPETVVCYRGGTWSKLPKCKEDFCLLNPAEHPDLMDTGNIYIKNGKTEYPRCVDRWVFDHYAVVRCIEGRLSVSRCCTWLSIKVGRC